MRGNKILKKTIVILTAVFAIVLFSAWSNANYWIRPANEIESINVRLTLKNGYKDITITDIDEIEYIRNMAADVQKNICPLTIIDAEACQKDTHIAMWFSYSNGKKQGFYAHKNKAGCFMGQNYDWKYVQLEHTNNNDFYDYFQENFA